MGKAKFGRRIAVQSARVMMDRVENLMKGGAIPKPVWYDAAKAVSGCHSLLQLMKYTERECEQNPPVPLPHWAPPPREIVFPEDRLMKIYKRRNPDWSFEVLKQHSAAMAKGEKTRGHMFVTQWQKYINDGVAEEDAYQKVEAEFHEIEGKVLAEQDAIVTKQLLTGTVPSMLEFQAEEDKYFAEAMNFHRTMWYARKNKTAAEAELLARKDAPAEPADDEPSAAADKGAGKKTAKTPKKK